MDPLIDEILAINSLQRSTTIDTEEDSSIPCAYLPSCIYLPTESFTTISWFRSPTENVAKSLNHEQPTNHLLTSSPVRAEEQTRRRYYQPARVWWKNPTLGTIAEDQPFDLEKGPEQESAVSSQQSTKRIVNSAIFQICVASVGILACIVWICHAGERIGLGRERGGGGGGRRGQHEHLSGLLGLIGGGGRM